MTAVTPEIEPHIDVGSVMSSYVECALRLTRGQNLPKDIISSPLNHLRSKFISHRYTGTEALLSKYSPLKLHVEIEIKEE